MHFMNDYDIEIAQHRFDTPATPNRSKVADVVARLADWANDNSDGWAYWPKPMRAAAKLGRLLELRAGFVRHEDRLRTDITDAELRAALAPIKSFLTRQRVDPAEMGL